MIRAILFEILRGERGEKFAEPSHIFFFLPYPTQYFILFADPLTAVFSLLFEVAKNYDRDIAEFSPVELYTRHGYEDTTHEAKAEAEALANVRSRSQSRSHSLSEI